MVLLATAGVGIPTALLTYYKGRQVTNAVYNKWHDLYFGKDMRPRVDEYNRKFALERIKKPGESNIAYADRIKRFIMKDPYINPYVYLTVENQAKMMENFVNEQTKIVTDNPGLSDAELRKKLEEHNELNPLNLFDSSGRKRFNASEYASLYGEAKPKANGTGFINSILKNAATDPSVSIKFLRADPSSNYIYNDNDSEIAGLKIDQFKDLIKKPTLGELNISNNSDDYFNIDRESNKLRYNPKGLAVKEKDDEKGLLGWAMGKNNLKNDKNKADKLRYRNYVTRFNIYNENLRRKFTAELNELAAATKMVQIRDKARNKVIQKEEHVYTKEQIKLFNLHFHIEYLIRLINFAKSLSDEFYKHKKIQDTLTPDLKKTFKVIHEEYELFIETEYQKAIEKKEKELHEKLKDPKLSTKAKAKYTKKLENLQTDATLQKSNLLDYFKKNYTLDDLGYRKFFNFNFNFLGDKVDIELPKGDVRMIKAQRQLLHAKEVSMSMGDPDQKVEKSKKDFAKRKAEAAAKTKPAADADAAVAAAVAAEEARLKREAAAGPAPAGPPRGVTFARSPAGGTRKKKRTHKRRSYKCKHTRKYRF